MAWKPRLTPPGPAVRKVGWSWFHCAPHGVKILSDLWPVCPCCHIRMERMEPQPSSRYLEAA